MLLSLFDAALSYNCFDCWLCPSFDPTDRANTIAVDHIQVYAIVNLAGDMIVCCFPGFSVANTLCFNIVNFIFQFVILYLEVQQQILFPALCSGDDLFDHQYQPY